MVVILLIRRDPAADPGGLGITLTIRMLVDLPLLWTAVILSIFKPGGESRWGRNTLGTDHRTGPYPQSP